MILVLDLSFGDKDYYPSFVLFFEGELKLLFKDWPVVPLGELQFFQFHFLTEIRFHPSLQFNPLTTLNTIFSWHQLI